MVRISAGVAREAGWRDAKYVVTAQYNRIEESL